MWDGASDCRAEVPRRRRRALDVLRDVDSVVGARAPQPAQRGTTSSALTNKAYSEMREAIGNLVLQPGEPLTEQSLSDWLGIGRTPVREALMMLRVEGLVEAIARKGYYVTRISADDANEIYEMLEGIEGIAIKLAAERAEPADIARLENAIEAQQVALDAKRLSDWVAGDEEFHSAIADAARNERIKKAMDPLNTQLHRLRVYTIRVRPAPFASTADHREQLDAIAGGDGDLARRLMQEHRARTRKVIVDIIRDMAGPHGGI